MGSYDSKKKLYPEFGRDWNSAVNHGEGWLGVEVTFASCELVIADGDDYYRFVTSPVFVQELSYPGAHNVNTWTSLFLFI